jgi:signal peptidase I
VKGKRRGSHRARHRADPEVSRRQWWLRTVRDIVVVVVAALAVSFLLKQLLIQTFSIPSTSMADTLDKDDRVVVSKLAPGPLDVHRGDIVVFKDPGDWLSPLPDANRSVLGSAIHGLAEMIGLAPPDDDQFLIKRVIALGGDLLECRVGDSGVGILSVNGTDLDEPYLAGGAIPCTEELRIRVADGALWVMGDNRQGSMDSRYHRGGPLDGAVDIDLVVGVAKLRLPPLSELGRLGILRNPGAVFADVPPGGGAKDGGKS